MRGKKKKELTEELKEYIKNNYKTKSILAMERETGAGKFIISNFMKENGLKVDKPLRTKRENDYSEKEIEFILNNYLNMTYKQIAETLGREESAIHNKANRLGLIKSNKWSKEDLEKLYKYYPIFPNSYLANKIIINHPRESINVKASELKIKKDRKFHYTRDQLKEILMDFANELGRTPTLLELSENDEMPSATSFVRYFGNYENLCNECGLKPNFCFGNREFFHGFAKDGQTLCLSNAELIVTNFLIDNNIKFEKEKEYSQIFNQDLGRIRCDWYLKDYDVIVEYFGFPEKEDYRNVMIRKENICKENHKELIGLFGRMTNKILQENFNKFIK